MSDINLYSKLAMLPDELKDEADDFLEFLKTKMEKNKESNVKKAGLAKGLIEMKQDFDEPLNDFEDYRD
jgi:hypothetical protein